MRSNYCLLFKLTLLLYIAIVPVCQAKSLPQVRAAVSANFSAPFLALKPELEQVCDCRVEHTFGSSGMLASQFDNGAPYDIFLSADSDKPHWLYKRGKTLFAPTTYAIGQLMLVDRHRDRLSSKDVAVALEGKKTWRMAIANAATAPYGVAAEQVLHAKPIDHKVTIVKGNSVLQALQYVITGNADQAIVAQSLMQNAQRHGLSTILLPQSLHTKIRQQLVVNKHVAEPLANTLVAFFTSARVQSELVTWGYAPIKEHGQ